jgi:hypothetical protein
VVLHTCLHLKVVKWCLLLWTAGGGQGVQSGEVVQSSKKEGTATIVPMEAQTNEGNCCIDVVMCSNLFRGLHNF